MNKLQFFISRKIPYANNKEKSLKFWKEKKRKFEDARTVIIKEHREEQLKQLAEVSVEQGNNGKDDNFNDAVSVGGSSIMSGGSIKSGLGTSSILLNSMQISGASRVV